MNSINEWKHNHFYYSISNSISLLIQKTKKERKKKKIGKYSKIVTIENSYLVKKKKKSTYQN